MTTTASTPSIGRSQPHDAGSLDVLFVLCIDQMNRRTRSLTVVGLLATVAIFLGFELQHQLSFEALKARQHALDGYQQNHPLPTAAAFFLTYVTVAALSLPFATVLTLAGVQYLGCWKVSSWCRLRQARAPRWRSSAAASCFVMASSADSASGLAS